MSRSPFVRRALALGLAAGLLAACSKETTTPVAALDGAAEERAAAIARPAWLRDRLPDHTVAYLRVPSIWGWLSAPNGRVLDAALASQAHVDAIRALRQAVREDKLIADSGMAPMLGLLLADLDSPVEIAVVDNGDVANPTSNVFASVQFDIADVAAMNARIAVLAKDAPVLKAPLDADGRGELAQKGFVRFDAANRRLFVFAGMSASASGLDTLIGQTAQTRPAEMAASEREVDASGQGLFFWLKLKGINGMAGAYLPQDASSALVRDFVQKSESVAGGWGTVDGHGRLQLRLRAPQARLLGYFAPNAPLPALKTAGAPQWAASLHLPDAQQWQQLVDQLDTDFGPGTRAKFDAAKNDATAKLGIDPLELLRRIGPAVVAFEDDAGSYSALQVSDRSALYQLLEQLGGKRGWRHDTIRSGTTDVHHLHIPGTDLDGASATPADAQSSAWMRLYARLGSHLYWVEDGDWLVFGSVPQALADRAAARPATDLAGWQKGQGYDAPGSLLGVTALTRGAQRTGYYAYLGGLQLVADAVGAKPDLASLPSASELKLPLQGAVGIALEARPDFLGLSLQYDATPLDALSGGGSMTTVAAAAIVAAVALPAYQDYTARAQVASVVAATGELKTYLAEHYIARGNFPDSLDEADVGETELGEMSKYLENFWIEDGTIVLQFGDEATAGLKEQTLTLTPYQLGTGVVWRCGNGTVDDAAQPLSGPETATTVPDKLLPASCR